MKPDDSASWRAAADLRREVNRLVGQVAARRGMPHAVVHAKLRAEVPGPAVGLRVGRAAGGAPGPPDGDALSTIADGDRAARPARSGSPGEAATSTAVTARTACGRHAHHCSDEHLTPAATPTDSRRLKRCPPRNVERPHRRSTRPSTRGSSRPSSSALAPDVLVARPAGRVASSRATQRCASTGRVSGRRSTPRVTPTAFAYTDDDRDRRRPWRQTIRDRRRDHCSERAW